MIILLKIILIISFFVSWNSLDSQKNNRSIGNKKITLKKIMLTVNITLVVLFLLFYYSREFLDYFLGWFFLSVILIFEQLIYYLGSILYSLKKKHILLISLFNFFFYFTIIMSIVTLWAIATQTYSNFFYFMYLIVFGILFLLRGLIKIDNFFEKHDFFRNFLLLMLYWCSLLYIVTLLEFLKNL